MALATDTNMADKVFQIPELLENILLHADARTVLKAQQVNRTFRDTINGSTKIQKAIGLLPNEKADFCVPLFEPSSRLRFHGMRYLFDSERSSFEQSSGSSHFLLSAVFEIYDWDFDTITKPMGPRCRSLSICQPPIKEMDIDLIDCSSLPRMHVEPQGKFLTVGDLQDAVVKMLRIHWLNCHTLRSADKCGAVLAIQATVKLRENDAGKRGSSG